MCRCRTWHFYRRCVARYRTCCLGCWFRRCFVLPLILAGPDVLLPGVRRLLRRPAALEFHGHTHWDELSGRQKLPSFGIVDWQLFGNWQTPRWFSWTERLTWPTPEGTRELCCATAAIAPRLLFKCSFLCPVWRPTLSLHPLIALHLQTLSELWPSVYFLLPQPTSLKLANCLKI